MTETCGSTSGMLEQVRSVMSDTGYDAPLAVSPGMKKKMDKQMKEATQRAKNRALRDTPLVKLTEQVLREHPSWSRRRARRAVERDLRRRQK